MKTVRRTALAAAMACLLLASGRSRAGEPAEHVPGMFEADPGCRLTDPVYSRDVYFRLMRYTTLKMPEDRSYRGAVSLHFFIGRDGQVADIVTLRKKGSKALDGLVHDVVKSAAPFKAPPFEDDHCGRLGLRIEFIFGMGDKAQEEWLKEGGLEPAGLVDPRQP